MCAERSVDMADELTNLTSESAEFLITNVQIYRELIIKHVKCGPIIGKMVIADEYHTMKEAMLVDVRNGQNSAATSKLLDYLDKMEDPRQYRHFVQLIDEHVDVNRFNITVIGEYSTIPGALVNTGNYCYLGKLLRGEKTLDPKKHKEHCRLIEFFSQEISHRIDFNALYGYLVEGDWMDEEDSQLLRRLNENNGRSSACSWLLYFVLPMRKENWLKQFLQLLRDIGCPELVKYITGEKCEAVKSASDYADSDMELDDRFDSERMDVVEASGEAHNVLSNLDTAPVDIYTWRKDSVDIKKNGYKDISDSESVVSSVEDNTLQQDLSVDLNLQIEDKALTQPLENRPYQEELAEAAVNGKNVIIIAPTGCGKTVVALNIMMAHLYKKGDKGKIAFFANEVTLVDQQHGLCKEHLPQTVKTYMLAGESKGKPYVPIKDVVMSNDIVFMTPQILVDSLADKSLASLSVFSLLVFDECHHVLSKHPTCRIMSSYIDMKLDAAGPLPQVVGLTASVGVGKSKSGIELDGAIKHIRTLCAKLDTVDGLVTVKKNKESLAEYTHFVQSDIKPTTERASDHFKDCIINIMKEIEAELMNMKPKLDLTKDTEQIKLELPLGINKGTEAYRRWMSQWYFIILPRCRNLDVRLACISYIEHLNIYNKALNINTDCRALDAFISIGEAMDKMFPRGRAESRTNWLLCLHEENYPTLKSCSMANANLNPKLILLQLEMLDQIKKKSDSRILVLVKTRDLTRALLRWMEADQQLNDLHPVVVTGCGASSDNGGMSRTLQIAAVKSFKWGNSRVAIATSVAEEGLDLAMCSRVIRYEYVSNEIGTIQARGRASRVEDGSYSLITANKSLSNKEEKNAHLESVMAEAVESIQKEFDLDPKKWKLVLQESQREDQRKRNQEKMQIQRPKVTGVFKMCCFKCGVFICKSSDIRVMNGSQHFVMTPIWTKVHECEQNHVSYSGVSKVSKVYCKRDECQKQWGVCVVYNDLRFVVLALKSVMSIDTQGQQYHVKNWKDARFICHELTDEEFEIYKESYSPPQNANGTVKT